MFKRALYLQAVFLLSGFLFNIASAHVPLPKDVEQYLKDQNLQVLESTILDEQITVGENTNTTLRQLLDSLLAELLLEKDGDGPIYLILIDDMRPNASIAWKSFNGAKAIFLNIGLIHFDTSDDMLACELAHELEHPYSTLQNKLDYILSSENLKYTDRFEAVLLRRSLEVEVDLRALAERVIQSRRNPYAMYDLLNRFIEKMGDKTTDLYPMLATRRDGVGNAITYWVRENGVSIGDRTLTASLIESRLSEEFSEKLTPDKRKTSIINTFRKKLFTETFKQERLKSLQELLAKIDSKIALPFYEEIKNLSSHDSLKKMDLNVKYIKEYRHIQSEAGRLVYGLVDDKEWTDIEIDIHQKLDLAFRNAKNAVFGATNRVQNIPQLIALKAIESREYPITSLNPLYLRKEITLLKEELKKLKEGDSNQNNSDEFDDGNEPPTENLKLHGLSLESAISEIEKKIILLTEKYEIAKHAYINFNKDKTDGKSIDEKLDNWISFNYSWRSVSEYEANSRTIDELASISIVSRLLENQQKQKQSAHELLSTNRELFLSPRQRLDQFSSPAMIGSLDLYLMSFRDWQRNSFQDNTMEYVDYIAGLKAIIAVTKHNFSLNVRDSHDTNNKSENDVTRDSNSLSTSAVIKTIHYSIHQKSSIASLMYYFLDLMNSKVEARVEIQQGLDLVSEWFDLLLNHASNTEEINLIKLIVEELFFNYNFYSENQQNPLKKLKEQITQKILNYGFIAFIQSLPKDNSIDSILLKLERFEENPPETFDQNALLKAAINRSQEILKKDGLEYSSEKIAAIFLASNPYLFQVSEHQKKQIKEDLIELASDSKFAQVAGKVLHRVPLAEIFLKTEEGQNEQNEEFYQLLLQVSPLLERTYHQQNYLFYSPNSKLKKNEKKAEHDLIHNWASWINAHAPNRTDLIETATYYGNWDLKEFSSFYKNRFLQHFKSSGSISQATYQLWKEFPELRYKSFRSNSFDRDINKKVVKNLTPNEANTQVLLEFLIDYAEGLIKWNDPNESRTTEYSSFYNMDLENYFDRETFDKLITDSKVFSKVDLQVLCRAFKLWKKFDEMWESFSAKKNSQNKKIQERISKSRYPNDELFEYLFEFKENPIFQKEFMDPQMIPYISFEKNKLALARWQLEKMFKLQEIENKIKTKQINIPKKEEIRTIVHEVFHFIEQQFPFQGLVRNALLEEASQQLYLTPAERDVIAPLYLNTSTVHEYAPILAADFSHILSSQIVTIQECFSVLKYMLGRTDKLTDLKFRQNRTREGKKVFDDTVKNLRSQLKDANLLIRGFTLQTLLDENKGIFSQPTSFEELLQLVLGEHYSNPLILKITKSYLKHLPIGERKTILAYILASLVQNKDRTPSLKTILEAMGPFGIKAGQFLRTSTLLSQRQREELNEFLDRALPPSRIEKVIPELEEIFGANLDTSLGTSLGSIVSVGKLLGSGSTSYVVELNVLDPESGQVIPTALRILKKGIAGQVQNENDIWKQVLADLMTDEDPQIKRQIRLINEARQYSLETLNPDGAELNFNVEREHFASGLIPEAYNAPISTKTGYKVEAIKPLLHLQKLIPEEYKNTAIFYELIQAEPAKNILPQHPEFAEQIVEAELEAIFVRRKFDPDTLPGNWFIEHSKQRLVRLDCAQIREVSKESVDAISTVLKALVKVQHRIDSKTNAILLKNLDKIFSLSGALKDKNVISNTLRTISFASIDEPIDRLMHIQECLEYVGIEASMQTEVRSILAALSRLSIYREWMPNKTYQQLLMKSFKFSYLNYALNSATTRISKVFTRARAGLKSICNRYLSTNEL